MKRLTIVVALLTTFIMSSATTAAAERNWVEQFLDRYRPSEVTFPAAAGQSQQELLQMIREGQLPLTVNDVVRLLLTNNLDIGVNRLSPLSARYLIESLYRPFEPTVFIDASVDRSSSPAISQLSGAPSLSQLNHAYTVGFAQTLATGTDVTVDFTLNRTSSNSLFATFNPSWTGGMRYAFTQHLLRDFGRSINTREIRIAQNNHAISDLQFERQVIDLVVQAQKSYWDLVFAAEDIKVKQRSLDLAQKTVADNQVQVRIGTLAPIDMIQAESEVATRREQLVVSTFTQVQGEDQVKKLITSQSDPGMVLARVTPMQSVRQPAGTDVPSIEEAIRMALENRPEMKELNLELTNRDIDIQYTRNQLLPNLDVSASYSQSGTGGTQTIRTGFGETTIREIIPGGLNDAFRQLFGFDFTGYHVGVSLQVPLRNRAAKAENARAVTEKRITENRINSTTQQIALEVRNALTQVEMNRARIEAAQKARELAERRLESEQKKFDLGASTIRFVLEEQRNVTQTQTNEIAALINYTKALVDLDRATGLTLAKNNIQIDKTD